MRVYADGNVMWWDLERDDLKQGIVNGWTYYLLRQQIVRIGITFERDGDAEGIFNLFREVQFKEEKFKEGELKGVVTRGIQGRITIEGGKMQ